jgi:hypothetical protein
MFVASLVIGLVVASEWARRLAIRGMCEATAAAEAARDAPVAKGAPRRRAGTGPLQRVVPLRPSRTDDADGIVAIPQWQRDP